MGARSQALAEQDQNATLERLRASIFHAAGAVFVFMQISQAASVIHLQAVPSLHPSPLTGPRGPASAAPVLSLGLCSRDLPVLSTGSHQGSQRPGHCTGGYRWKDLIMRQK